MAGQLCRKSGAAIRDILFTSHVLLSRLTHNAQSLHIYGSRCNNKNGSILQPHGTNRTVAYFLFKCRIQKKVCTHTGNRTRHLPLSRQMLYRLLQSWLMHNTLHFYTPEGSSYVMIHIVCPFLRPSVCKSIR